VQLFGTRLKQLPVTCNDQLTGQLARRYLDGQVRANTGRFTGAENNATQRLHGQG
jgi:hypothetical protein